MNTHEITAYWRAPEPNAGNRWGKDLPPPPVVHIVEGATLDDPFAETMRFSLAGDGTFLLGDAHAVMHRDIAIAASKCGHGEPLMIGVILRDPENPESWLAMTQPGGTMPTILFPRLSTWADLIGSQDVQLRDGYNARENY